MLLEAARETMLSTEASVRWPTPGSKQSSKGYLAARGSAQSYAVYETGAEVLRPERRNAEASAVESVVVVVVVEGARGVAVVVLDGVVAVDAVLSAPAEP